MAEDYDRLQRLFDLRRRRYQGGLSEAEERELAELNRWSSSNYGLFGEIEVPGVTDVAGGETPDYIEDEGGGGHDLTGLDTPTYANFTEMINAIGNQFGMGVPGYNPATGQTTYTSWSNFGRNLLTPLSPIATTARAVMGRSPFGHESRYAMNDPERIDYQALGINAAPADQFGYNPAIDRGPLGPLDAFGGRGPDVSQDDDSVEAAAAADQAANAAAAAAMEAEHGIGLDAFGGPGGDPDAGPDADGPDGNDTDPGGDFRRGGLIRGDRDGVLEPRTIEAHETEYVVRPEAVEAIGVPALDRLNRMGRNPEEARQSSGIPALDALSDMRRPRNRGLYHSRRMGRVMGGGDPDAAPGAVAPAPRETAEAAPPRQVTDPSNMSDAMAPRMGNGLMRRMRLGGR